MLTLDEKVKFRLLNSACFFLFLTLYGITSRASVVSSDEVATFGTSVNLATQHVLHIDNLLKVHRITSLGERGVDGHLYAKYFPGNILSAAVVYRLSSKIGDTPYIWSNPKYGSFELAPSRQGARIALRLNAVLGALGMVMLFLFSLEQYQWRTAVVTVLLIGLTTDWWYESRLFFSEIGAGAFLMACFYFANKKSPYLSSLSLAISLLFRPTNLLALPLWAYALRGATTKKILSGIFIGLSLGILAAYNYVRFDSFTNFGYGEEGFTTSLVEGLKGVILSPGHSMFIYSPIAVLAFWGGFILYKKNRTVMLLTTFCIVGYILTAASWHSWFGGKVWGSRLVVPIIPMLGILIAPMIDKLFNHPSKMVMISVLLLGVVGLGIQFLTVAQNPMIAITEYIDNGYATQAEAIWSLDKNWLVLEIKSLMHWKPCNIDAYSLRLMFSECR